MSCAQRQSAGELAVAAQSGDARAFEELAARYRDGVYALCLTRTGDFDVAEDLTQEALLRAHRELRNLREPEAFGGWLRQIAMNCCGMWQRRPWPTSEGLHPRLQAQVGDDVFREAARREAARGIRAALAELPENNRLALLMFYLGGSTCREIAEFTGVPESTVAGRLWRARDKLRRLLAERLQDELSAR